jgi:hypothetical protein
MQGVGGLVAVVRPVTPVCVARKRFVMSSRTVHGYKSNLEKVVQVEVREFLIFASDAEAKTSYEKQATTTSSNVSCIPLVQAHVAPPSNDRCWMTSGSSLGTGSR